MPRKLHQGEFDGIRPGVFARDGGLCCKCGRDGEEVHHVNGYWDNDPSTMRTLCRRCHLIAPQGDDYWIWELRGSDGWEDCARWAARALSLPFSTVFGRLAEYERFTKFTSVFRAARQRMKAKTGRCEGRKPYGFRPGEQAVIERMRELRAAGMGYDRIAEQLNAEGIKPRRGVRWWGRGINNVLKEAR